MVNGRQVHIVIVAAGTGNRFGSNLPKQFHLLEGRPVLMRTIDAFRSHGDITLVLSPAMTGYWAELCARYDFKSPRVVHGGATRFESVRNALDVLDFGPDDIILVHDGARPLASHGLIDRVTDALDTRDAVVPATPVTDSLRVIDTDGSSRAVDRAVFRAVQTPQGFRAAVLADAYAAPYSTAFTDDASVVEAAGTPIAIVDGDPDNFKITTPIDLELAQIIIGPR